MSAADLQKRHAELEGAPDPFPSLVESPVKARPAPASNGTLDTDSAVAFPSLASSSPASNRAPVSAWSAPRIKATASKQPLFTDSLTTAVVDLSTAGRDGKPTSLGEIMKHIMAQYKVKLDASTNQKLRQTTFFLKAEQQKDLEKAKKALLSALSPTVSIVVNAPASTIPSIIGVKGVNLKEIRDRTGVRIDIPRRDTLGQANGGSHDPSRNATPLPGANDDEEDEPTVPITITGAHPLAVEAQGMLQDIIATKTSYVTRRVKDIPAHILPFVIAQRPKFLAAAQGGDVQLILNQTAFEISVSGDREAVERVIESIKSARDYFQGEVTSVNIMLPKRQHRLLTGKGADEVMAKSKCAVIIQSLDEPGDEVNVYGRGVDIGNGVSAVMEKANSAYIHEFPLPGPIAVSKQLLGYMTRVGYPQTLSEKNPGVSVYTPPAAVIEKATVLNVDLVGDKSVVDSAVRELSQLLGKLICATRDVPIDWLVHRIINSHKNAKKLKAFHEQQNVLVFFPPESAEQSSVLLVYDPTSPSASPSPVEKAQKLEEVEAELLKMAKAAADVKTQTITVEKKWHDAVIGYGGTTLNAIIGEDKTLSIKLGAEAGDATTEDIIVVRGISADVNRAVKEIEQIVEAAKNDEIVSSYSTEFEIGREFVARIVGAQGAGVNKIRDTLGVKVDFSDDHDDKEKDAGKKKKSAAGQKVKVKITGRKENAEEAKRRINSQVDKLADETVDVLKVPRQYHPSLIGQGGKYVVRLEDKYDVKITFPRDGDHATDGRRDVPKQDEVIVRGGRKGVTQAKNEILDALEFEKENNNQIKFTVPTRSVARILGRGGASINEIKDDTGAQIDIDKAADNTEVSTVVLRGTKAAIADAKAAIIAISDQVTEEVTDSVTIEHKFHRSLIGPGGQGLKDLISRCSGPTDPKAQAGLVRFPRPGDTSDEVTLRGEPKLVAKIKTELEKVVANLRDRVVLGVEIPAVQHRALIGRGGQHLTDLQNRTGAQVQFPGSRSYNSVGEPVNAEELANASPTDLVKVSGTRAACEKAVEELKSQVKAPAPEGVTGTLTVPLKYHHAVTQQGNLFRSLKSFGVHVEQSASPKNPPVPARPAADEGTSSARIDDTESVPSVDAQWQVVLNYQNAEEGEATWTFKAPDQATLDKATTLTSDSIKHAEEMTHVGFLTLPDRSVFPRIVGAKGANVARLRAESKADITVSRDDNTIVIIGSESALETAKDAIHKMTIARPPRGGRRERD